MKNRRGFTLVELLVVVAIIGILGTVVIISVQNAQKKARNAKRQSDVQTLAKALHVYYTEQEKFPENTTPGSACYIGKFNNGKQCFKDILDSGYIGSSIPMGPKKDEYYRYYNYSGSNPKHITLWTDLEPQEYGPFEYGWNCSGVVGKGWWTGMESTPIGTVKRYCDGFVY